MRAGKVPRDAAAEKERERDHEIVREPEPRLRRTAVRGAKWFQKRTHLGDVQCNSRDEPDEDKAAESQKPFHTQEP